MNENFTIVNDPLIEHVIDQANGKEYRAGEFVFQTPREISEVRMRVFDALKRGEPNIVCAACHTPVYPRKYVDSVRIPAHADHDSGVMTTDVPI